jgi:hypothetical protein
MADTNEQLSFADRMDAKWKWAFPPLLFAWMTGLFILGMTLGYVLGLQHNSSSMVAIIGAFAACCGIITLGRPMIRLGGYKAWAKSEKVKDYGSIVPTIEEIEKEKQEDKDAFAVQIIGPALAIVGTMVNGISGIFS